MAHTQSANLSMQEIKAYISLYKLISEYPVLVAFEIDPKTYGPALWKFVKANQGVRGALHTLCERALYENGLRATAPPATDPHDDPADTLRTAIPTELGVDVEAMIAHMRRSYNAADRFFIQKVINDNHVLRSQ